MAETPWLMGAALLGLAGMAWLALGMEVHWSQVMHRPVGEARYTRLALRAMGAVALLLSLLSCLKADRPSMAALVWVMLLAGSALVVAITLARRPSLLALAWPDGKRRVVKAERAMPGR